MSRVRNFCITVNNWADSDLIGLKSVDIISYGIMGEEVGKNGTPHLQGYVQLSKATTMKAFQKTVQRLGVRCHLAIAKGSSDQNIDYCSKEAEGASLHIWGECKRRGARSDLAQVRDMIRAGGTNEEIVDLFPGNYFRYGKEFRRFRKVCEQEVIMAEYQAQMEKETLRPWQLNVLNKLLEQDDRHVLWIVDYIGNTGKSFLSKYLSAIHGAFEVTGGKTQDIAFAYAYQPIVVFDLSRQKQEYVNYGVIEDFKNGRIFSPKYESKTIRFTPAKVVVFSNWDPDESMLSRDRWDIIRKGVKPIVNQVFTSGFHFQAEN